MLFSEFVSEMELLKELHSLMEADTVEWDPAVGAEFKGVQGVTGDASSGPSRQQKEPAQRRPVQKGDFISLRDRSGRSVTAVVASVENGEVLAINPYASIKGKYPISALTPAQLGQYGPKVHQLMAKNPGRKMWFYNEKLATTL